MHLFNSRRRKVLATFATCVVAGLGGLAIASWLTDGEGEGTSKGGSLTQPTVTASATEPSGMLPGGTGMGVFTINNPNAVPLDATEIQTAVTPGGTSSDPNCPISNVTVNAHQFPARTVAANGTTELAIPDAYKLAADAPNDCQGATFKIRARILFKTQ